MTRTLPWPLPSCAFIQAGWKRRSRFTSGQGTRERVAAWYGCTHKREGNRRSGGDIAAGGACARLDGDTICDEQSPLCWSDHSRHGHPARHRAEARADQTTGGGHREVIQEDPTLRINTIRRPARPSCRAWELHLEIIVTAWRPNSAWGELGTAVAYRETIRGSSQSRWQVHPQTGGMVSRHVKLR